MIGIISLAPNQATTTALADGRPFERTQVTTEAARAVVLDSSLKRVVIDLLAGLRMGYPPASLSD